MFRAMDWLLAPFEYELTTWHPLAVHVPVVLVPLGALGACVYAFTGRPRVRAGLLVWFAVTALATWWAMRTGKALYEGVEGTPIVEELIAQHRTTAAWVLRFTIALVLLLAGLSAWRRWRRASWRKANSVLRLGRDPLWVRAVVVLLAFVAALLVVYTGHVGGVMVWGR
ncbi:MAG: DUF2231 domain-containing protein [Bacteroidota bacterium]